MDTKSARQMSRGVLLILGLAIGGFGGWWAETEYTIVRTWPTTDALIVKEEIVLRRGSKQSNLYAPEITFQYEVEGKRYTSTDKSMASTSFMSWPEHVLMASTSFMSWPEHVLNANPIGAHRVIHYNPSDPGKVQLNAGYNFSTFGAPGIFIAAGLFFFILFFRTYLSPKTTTTTDCPSCGAPVEFGRNTCPKCGTSISISPDAPAE